MNPKPLVAFILWSNTNSAAMSPRSGHEAGVYDDQIPHALNTMTHQVNEEIIERSRKDVTQKIL